MNVEELKTAIGHLQLDLRGNWGWDYKERLEDLIYLLNQLRSYVVSVGLARLLKRDFFEAFISRTLSAC
jgi:hypothetical protein